MIESSSTQHPWENEYMIKVLNYVKQGSLEFIYRIWMYIVIKKSEISSWDSICLLLVSASIASTKYFKNIYQI